MASDVLERFARLYDFGLDDFQVEACQALAAGQSVLVAAPTGSGKTVVGECAIHLAVESGRKCFYTAPIKALSNQKYAELVQRYGPDRVGLLTGDNTINGEAQIVVMTTEVLRNMIYAESDTLADLGWVVMDEVHYLADRSRGAVWEEVIIHLPQSVALACLSATVSNAEEFGDWLQTVRGEVATVVSEQRPVPLYQHMLVGRRLYDLFGAEDSSRLNPELLRVARDDRVSRQLRDRRSPRGSRNHRSASGNGRRVWQASRPDTVERLGRADLLPAIVFVFSRAGCDAAVEQCIRAGIRLTTDAERDQIFDFVTEACANLPDEDVHAVGYHDLLDGLTRGIAAHHAGMLPVFKECVEVLFQRGLCKVVFATETLALGINMPARSVVLESMTKWNGETHAEISAGEYTQLTGRAGRRGIDVEGHAVVQWRPGLDPRQVASLASTRTYPLNSSFRPSYNMAVNLVARVGRETARELLETSFAQYQADRAVVGLARQLRKAEDALAGYAESAQCSRGDFMEYMGLRRRIAELEKTQSKRSKEARRDQVADSLRKLRRGDLVWVPGGKAGGWAVVIGSAPPHDANPRPSVLTVNRQFRRISAVEVADPVEALAMVRIPRKFNPRSPDSRKHLSRVIAERASELDPPRRGGKSKRHAQRSDSEVDRLRQQMRSHPCHDCPDREAHARWGERWVKLDKDTATLRRRIERRTNVIARQFDRICVLLESLGYLGSGPDPAPTEAGETLARIYNELDLLTAESILSGAWDDLDPAELAAVLSALVFEARRPDDAEPPRIPRGAIQTALNALVRRWAELETLEKDAGLPKGREPDLGFVYATWRWADGALLVDVLDQTGMSPGDFVRWTKQVIDLAGQVANAAPHLRSTARAAVAALRRGVVAAEDA